MDSPFIFAKEVAGDAFVGRKEELAWLASNIANKQNTVLIAPDKWGKSSLMRMAIIQAQKQNFELKICTLSLFNVREELDFYAAFVEHLLLSIASTSDEWESIVEQHLPLSAPKVVVSERRQNVLRVLFTPEAIAEYGEEILSLPDRLAQASGFKIMYCIEEFQYIYNLPVEDTFLKRLRKMWQSQESVGYLLSGGDKFIMRELVEKSGAPFYKFGELLHLNKIEDKLFIDYIQKAFSKSGRVINKEFAQKVCDVVKCHPYYVQQLSHLVWLNTKGFVTDLAFETGVSDLLNSNNPFFQKDVDGMSNHQLSYLKAVVEEVDRFTSAEVLATYKLNSSANVTRVRGAMEKKGVLEFIRSKPRFIDPVFELWFTQHFLR